MKKKLLSVVLTMSMILALAGCSKNEREPYVPNSNTTEKEDLTKDTDKNTSNETVKNNDFNLDNTEVITIASIKNKYGTLDKTEIKPFYNVDQKTQFTFHFNAKDIEPSHAVTVHTDSKCEVNSTVYQINDGYLVNDGLDVVVKPGSPVLQDTDDNTRYTWGKAPVYYLSINYDMEATTPTKLDTPIVVPFTIKSNVSTPNLEASIDTTGKFQIQWKSVEGATKYNIYEANYVRRTSPSFGLLRAECGYAGDHLNLIASVDSSTTTFDGFELNNGSNIQTDTNGYIVSQNTFIPSNYYVAAVDSQGNESQYSMAVSGWKFESQLPYTFDSYTGFEKNSMGHVSKLPDEVNVQMKDGSYASFPINFKKISEDYGCAQYEYSIVGTLLTGKIEYENETKEYANIVNSKSSMNYGVYQVKNDINIIPENTINAINDDTYSNSVINVSKQVEYPESSKLIYSSVALLRRADIEGARMINDGVYSDGATPNDIDTYKESNQSATPHIKEETNEKEETPVNEVPDEITSENLVQEQIESTQKEVEEANDYEVPQAQVMYFADSAEEEYLAMMMIARQEVFDVSAFPSLQNTEHLVDVLQKVSYQNPYIISPLSYGYAPEEKVVVVEYAYSPEETFKRQTEISEAVNSITSSIITSGMSNEEKVNAIWKYFEDNTKYDDEALKAAEASNFSASNGHEDAFGAYGILCKNVGVCQSYSYSYKLLLAASDVPCVTLTGYLDKTLPHAWNAVQLDEDNWYWLDATNNKNVTGIPYYLYQTSSDMAIQADYVLDNMYDIDTNLDYVLTNDNSKDWWYANNLYAESIIDLPTAFSKSYKMGAVEIEGLKVVAIKNIGNVQVQDLTEDTLKNMVQSLYTEGMTQEQITGLQIGSVGNYLILLY